MGRTARGVEQALEPGADGLFLRHRVHLGEGIAQQQRAVDSARLLVAAVGTAQAVRVDHEVDVVLGTADPAFGPGRLVPPERRVVAQEGVADGAGLRAPAMDDGAGRHLQGHAAHGEGRGGQGQVGREPLQGGGSPSRQIVMRGPGTLTPSKPATGTKNASCGS